MRRAVDDHEGKGLYILTGSARPRDNELLHSGGRHFVALEGWNRGEGGRNPYPHFDVDIGFAILRVMEGCPAETPRRGRAWGTPLFDMSGPISCYNSPSSASDRRMRRRDAMVMTGMCIRRTLMIIVES